MSRDLPINRMREAVRERRPSLGVYVRTPSTMMIEMLGHAGLDFVRIDLNAGYFNTETIEDLIRTANAVGITPIVRVERNDWVHLQTVLGLGALGIIVPEIKGKADAEMAIRAVKLPPVGERHVPSGAPTKFGLIGANEYARWAAENIILSVQIETRGAVDQVDAIVNLHGIDMVQCGRGTLSRDYGFPGEEYHPKMMEIEEMVVNKALAAGKLVGLQYYPLRDSKHLAIIKNWIERGVQCISLGIDSDIVFAYRSLLEQIAH